MGFRYDCYFGGVMWPVLFLWVYKCILARRCYYLDVVCRVTGVMRVWTLVRL